VQIILRQVSLSFCTGNLVNWNRRPIRSVRARGSMNNSVIALSLNDLGCSKDLAQSLIIHYVAVVNRSNFVVRGVGQRAFCCTNLDTPVRKLKHFNALAASMLEIRCNLSSFTSRSWRVWCARSTRPLAAGELAHIPSMLSS
jgi:hypothetical protein